MKAKDLKGIYRDSNNSPLELIRDFLPEEVSHTKYHKNGDIVVHEFRFELIKFDSSFKLSYTHVAEHYLNKEEGGLTNVWCNPFEDNHACNHLIFVICNIDNMQECVIKLYEFLVANDIEFIDNTK